MLAVLMLPHSDFIQMSEYKFISHQIQVDLERSIGEVPLNVLGEIMLARVMINNNKLQINK